MLSQVQAIFFTGFHRRVSAVAVAMAALVPLTLVVAAALMAAAVMSIVVVVVTGSGAVAAQIPRGQSRHRRVRLTGAAGVEQNSRLLQRLLGAAADAAADQDIRF